MLLIGVRSKPMKIAKQVDGFFGLSFGLNNEYGGNFEGGFPPLMGVRRGMCSLTDLAICGFSDPTFVLCCVPEAFPLL